MKCPICELDLSPLDLISRTEHVELCIENGPSVLEVSESGGLVVKRNLPPGKQRKICPICDKTFQNLNLHFKTCAIKNDVPPNLMLDHWDKINSDSRNPKKFPRELLDAFVAKCIKDGRVGDQVDFARALSLSMAESEPHASSTRQHNSVMQQNQEHPVGLIPEATNDSVDEPIIEPPTARPTDANRLLMQNATSARATTTNRRQMPRKKYRLELADELTKRANVELRVDRELAATRNKRYYAALLASRRNSGGEIDAECVILDDYQPHQAAESDNWRGKLFFLNRMKDCNGSEVCLAATCQDHELKLLLDEFKVYSGASMDAPAKRRCDVSWRQPTGSEEEEDQQQQQQQQEQQQEQHDEPALA